MTCAPYQHFPQFFFFIWGNVQPFSCPLLFRKNDKKYLMAHPQHSSALFAFSKMYIKMILYQTPVDTYGLLDKSGSLTADLNPPHFLICETRFSVSRVSRSLNIQLLPSRGFSWAAPQTWWGSWHFTVTAPVWQEEEEQGAMLASCTPGDRHPTCPLSYVWLFTTGPQIGNWDEVAFLHSAIYKTFNQFLNQ